MEELEPELKRKGRANLILDDKEFLIIKRACKYLGIPISVFCRQNCLEKAREILQKFQKKKNLVVA